MLELVEVAAVVPGEEKVAAAVIVERKRVGVVVPVGERDCGHAWRGAGGIGGGRHSRRDPRRRDRLGLYRESLACMGRRRGRRQISRSAAQYAGDGIPRRYVCSRYLRPHVRLGEGSRRYAYLWAGGAQASGDGASGSV